MALTEHYMTPEAMQAALARGESVILHQPGKPSRLLQGVGAAPSAAELAQGDPTAEAAALARIDSEIARLAAQRALLTHKPAGALAAAEPPADPPPAGGERPAPKGGKRGEAGAETPPPDDAHPPEHA